MLRRVFAVAMNTYRESVRARILIGLAAAAFAVSFYSLIIGAYTLKYAPRVVSNIGTASLSFYSIVVAVLIGATSLHRELEQKTIFPILARPIRRTEYLAGKYLGTLLTLGTFVMADAGLILFLGGALGGRPIELVFGLGGLLVLGLALAMIKWPAARTYGPIPWAFLVMVAGAWLCGSAPDERRVILGSALLSIIEVSVVVSLTLLFSSFSTPFLSAILTLGLVVAFRNADLLAKMPVKQVGPLLHSFFFYMSKVVPNLQIYVPPRPLLTGEALDANVPLYFARAAVHGVAWSAGLFASASFIFKRRDFL
ncbi:MAG: ABC transporter permease subunit [Polyangiaceae bacterium]|nr:ABC transporter permease subunit [Polyangiaceae bacterium]